MKICSKCKIKKDDASFNKRAAAKDGLNSHCKECQKEYRIINKDSIKTYDANRYAETPDKAKILNKKWRSNNVEKIRISHQNYRAKKRKLGGKLSGDIKLRLFKLQRGRCPCCGYSLGENYHLDHIIPLALGGANEDWNIQLLRSTCNQQKHAKHPIEFMQSRGFLI